MLSFKVLVRFRKMILVEIILSRISAAIHIWEGNEWLMVRKRITLGNVLMCIIVIVLVWVFIVALVVSLSSPVKIPSPNEVDIFAYKIAKGIINPFSLIVK